MATKISGRNNCQLEADEVFSKLSSWREETYRQFSNILSCHSNISEGIRDLTEEVWGLQLELTVVRKEKSVLLETVDNLNGDIRQLNAKLLLLTPPEEELDIVKEEQPHEATLPATEDNQAISESICEYDQHKYSDYETVMDQDLLQQTEYLLHKNDSFKRTPHGEEKAWNADKVENIPSTEQRVGGNIICPECKIEFSSNSNLIIHMKNVHKMTRTRSSTHDEISSHVCDECGYASATNCDMKRHKVLVHKVGEAKFKCEMCSFASQEKNRFDGQMASVHKIGRAMFKCNICPYSSPNKCSFENHMVKTHKIGEAKFKCELCPFASSFKGKLNEHVKGVHEKIKKFLCEKCSFRTYRKSNLKEHKKRKH